MPLLTWTLLYHNTNSSTKHTELQVMIVYLFNFFVFKSFPPFIFLFKIKKNKQVMIILSEGILFSCYLYWKKKSLIFKIMFFFFNFWENCLQFFSFNIKLKFIQKFQCSFYRNHSICKAFLMLRDGFTSILSTRNWIKCLSVYFGFVEVVFFHLFVLMLNFNT